MFRILSPSCRQIQHCFKFSKHSVKCQPFPQLFHTSSPVTDEDNKQPRALELTSDNAVKRIYKKMFSGLPAMKLKLSGNVILLHCTEKTDLLGFIAAFDMPDTFYSWFLVSELHIWLVGSRLMNEGDTGRIVRNAMVEELWNDCDSRAKAIGVATSLRQKQIVKIAQEFQASLFIYDEGLIGDDMQLANALWRRFFLSMKENEEEELDSPDSQQLPDPEQLLLLVNYVRRVSNYLDTIDAVDIIVTNNIKWPELVEKK